MSNSERPALSLTQLVKTYVSLVGGPALALWVILQFGSLLTSNRSPAHSTTAIRAAASQTQAATAAAPSPNPDLPLRIVVILVAARLVGLLVRRIGHTSWAKGSQESRDVHRSSHICPVYVRAVSRRSQLTDEPNATTVETARVGTTGWPMWP